MMKKNIIGIIPARGGSKRLPRKNILNLNGKPLITWTINAGIKSNFIDELIVSTEDDEIAKISKDYGANIPFIRPKNLAEDTTSSFDVVKHTLEFYSNELDINFEFFILLQPTSPLRNNIHIDEAVKLLEKKNAEAIISVSKMEHHPLKSNILPINLSLENFQPDSVKNKRMQDFPIYYRENGAIYIEKVDRFLEEKTFFIKDNIFGYIMDQIYSIDIDTQLDLKYAEFLIENVINKKI